MRNITGTRRKQDNQAAVIAFYRRSNVNTAQEACRLADVPYDTYEGWVANKTDHAWQNAWAGAKAFKSRQRAETAEAAKTGLVIDPERVKPEMPDFTTFRRDYIGRPVTHHQRHVVEAYEDLTNRFIMVLGPTGSGKDTTAGDFVLHAATPNFSKRVAWLMRSETFSRRRLSERLAPYLTEPKTYKTSPEGPDTTVPTRSLIEDFGPFAWQKGMKWTDGTPVDRSTWTKNEMYFVGTVGATEADPNLWATGIDGRLYGSRVDLMVVSDPFDRENQLSSEKAGQVEWFKGTMRSRLDTKGRLIILGTRVLPGDNYEVLLEYFAANARVIYRSDDGYYTKYANGFATVIHPAIDMDDQGREVSYWPDVFPMQSYLILPDGAKYDLDTLDDETHMELARNGAEIVEGLTDRREADWDMFETTMQQKPPTKTGGEFTDLLLDHCDDPTRTFGQVMPGEQLVQGVDPARTGGAAWVMLGVNRDNGTIICVDYFFGKKLGVEGIRNQLVIDPITMYRPRYLEYEDNREASTLVHPEVIQTARQFSVNLRGRNTNESNRNKGEEAVAMMAFDMRDGIIRFPAGRPEDRERLFLLKEHFHNWDRKMELREARSKAFTAVEDDIVMAFWMAWRRATQLLGKSRNPYNPGQVASMPEVMRKRWAPYMQHQGSPDHKSAPPATDLVAVYYSDHGDHP